ncbi:hydrolase [Cytobacillus spongiae]|uniref:hydrolase n=1 Tax=Cytobacillus spongiae TaxID=2901381 RepID=UPI001F27DD73|nr:hydrolase [Cytobacillus spongiae]UII56999.1 hydrolase [Cytobacillus spongiae]
MESRNFQLDTEWNMIHYPKQPTGFGVLIIGDERHYVDEKSSFWTQNEGKRAMIEKLKNEGYTVFYSNLYGKNWGSERAVELAKRLYEYMIRMEILNEKIHLLAEGMGALVALKLMDEMKSKIRSVLLVNPVLSLSKHLEQEKEHKFFYKKVLKELAYSYGTEITKIEDTVIKDNQEPNSISNGLPVQIIHVLSGNRAYKQSNILKQLSVKWEDAASPVTVTYMLPEKKQQIGYQMTKFFKKNETNL